jgi:predicted transcriptional regulator
LRPATENLLYTASSSEGKLRFEERASMTTEIKSQAHQLINRLPDSATWSDVPYALELRADVEQGLSDANAGRVTTIEEVRQEYAPKR